MRANGSSGSFGFAWAKSGGGWLGFIWFIRVRVVSRLRSQKWQVSFGFAWVHSGGPWGRRVHSRSRGSTHAELGVVEFIQVRLGLLGRD